MISTRYIAILIWVATAYIGACTLLGCTTTGEPNWDAISTEMTLGAQDLRDATQFVDDGDAIAMMIEIADVLDLLATQAGDPPVDTLDVIDGALDLIEDLVPKLDEDTQANVRLLLYVARSALRRYRAYIPPAE